MSSKVPLRRLSDPRELRALAHPARVRIVEELAFDSPLTATELADRLGESPANCSWHLRQLAKFGYVEEAPGRAGRRRPWRIVVQSHSYGDSDDPLEAAAAGALEDVLERRDEEELEAWRRREQAEPKQWREAAFGTRSYLWLTAAELTELQAGIYDLVVRHLDRFTDPAARPPGSRPIRFVAKGFPTRTASEDA